MQCDKYVQENILIYLLKGQALLYAKKLQWCHSYLFWGIRYHQIFSWGYRTKMKIWSDENEKLVEKFFAHKKGFPNFSPAPGFFRRGATENH